MITQLSNLALQLYSWYVRHGHARNEQDETGVKEFFKKHLPQKCISANRFLRTPVPLSKLLLVCLYPPGFFNVLPLCPQMD